MEEGRELAPRFDADGLIPVVTTDHETGEVLMVANMNAEAFAKTIELGEAVYYSRSRKQLWHKGATSGLVQRCVRFWSTTTKTPCGCGSMCKVGRAATWDIARAFIAVCRLRQRRKAPST